jgi:hypothetical protein
MQTVPYLIFDGNCEEVLEFYAGAFGGKPDIMRYSDMPADGDMEVSDAWKDKIMHAELALGDGQLIYIIGCLRGIYPNRGRQRKRPHRRRFRTRRAEVLRCPGRRRPGYHARGKAVLGRGLREPRGQVRHRVGPPLSVAGVG